MAGTVGAIIGDNVVDSIWPDGGDEPPDTPSATQATGGKLLDYAQQVTTPAPPEPAK